MPANAFNITTVLLLIIVVFLIVFDIKLISSSNGVSQDLLRMAESHNQTTDDRSAANNDNYDFTGRYRLIKSDNFDRYLKELGIGYIQRSVANKATSDYEITRDGQWYTLRTISPLKSSEITFTLDGKTFDEHRMDGVTVKSSMVRVGRKWIQTQRNGDQVIRIIREWIGDQIVVTSVLNKVAFVRIYKKL